MFYQLNTLLQGLPGARLMTYISFRAIVAAVLAMLISILLGEYFINFMKRHQFFEQQRTRSWIRLTSTRRAFRPWEAWWY